MLIKLLVSSTTSLVFLAAANAGGTAAVETATVATAPAILPRCYKL